LLLDSCGSDPAEGSILTRHEQNASRRYSLCLTSAPPEQIMQTSEVEAILAQVSGRVSCLVRGRSFQNLRRFLVCLGNCNVGVSVHLVQHLVWG
jgi:hypothetical protein